MLTLAERGIPVADFDRDREKAEHPDIVEDAFWSMLPKVRPYTELSTAVLYHLYCATRYVVLSGIEGDLVECGVHLGGSVMTMEHVLQESDEGSVRRIFALDTFHGFVRRSEELDIDIASGLPACIPEPAGADFSQGSADNMRSVGFARLQIVKGDVLQTIPTLDVEKIALLRLDTDTYDTTRFELEQLYHRVVPGGVVIVDDYGYTFGCKKAVDDFIASRPVFLQRINRYCRAWVKIEL